LQKLTDTDLSQIEYYHCKIGKIANYEMIISRTGYTGELGFEIYFRAMKKLQKMYGCNFQRGRRIWNRTHWTWCKRYIKLEKGYCLYGNDIDQTTNPLEAGLGWITKLNKDNFIGKDALVKSRQKASSEN
jgi:aminomethyltransferase